MTIPSFSEAAVRRQATAESFRRGESYYQGGAVVSLVQRGSVLQAEVEGSQYEPYRVRIIFDEGGVTSAACDCCAGYLTHPCGFLPSEWSTSPKSGIMLADPKTYLESITA